MSYLLVWVMVSTKITTLTVGQMSMSLPSLKTQQRGADFGLSASWSSLLNPQYGSSQTTTNLNLPGNTNYFGTQFLSGEPTSISSQLHPVLPKSTMDISQLQQGSQPQPQAAPVQGQRQNPLFNNYLTYPSYLQAISSDVFNPFGPGNPYNNVTASASQAPLQAVNAFPGVQQNFLQSPLTLPSTWSALNPQTFQPATRTANFQPAPNAAQSGNAFLNTNYLSQFTFPYGQGQFGYPLTFGQGTNANAAPAQVAQQPKPVTENKQVQQAPPKHSRPHHRGERPRSRPQVHEIEEDSREPEAYRSKPSYEEEEEEEEEAEEEDSGPTYRSTSYYKPGRSSEEEEDETPEDQYEESTSVNSKNCDKPEDNAGFSASNFEEQFKSFPTNTNFRDPDFTVEASNVKEVTTASTVEEEEDSDADDSDSSKGQRIPSTLHYYNYKPPKYIRHGKPAEYFPNNPFKKPKTEHNGAPHKRVPKAHKDTAGHHPSSKSVYMVKKMY